MTTMFVVPWSKDAACYVCGDKTMWRVETSNGGHVPICTDECAKHWPTIRNLREYIQRIEKYIRNGDLDLAQHAVRRRDEELETGGDSDE